MNKRVWIIPIMIVATNVLAVFVKWTALTELLPAHFDLHGNASGSMPRTMLLVYPVIGVVISLIAYFFARVKPKFQTALVILTSGIGLILLSSTLVTLTSGKFPVFMLAEPIILLATIVGSISVILSSRKKSSERDRT